MKKYFYILILILASACPAFAQFTTVTATVQDPNGIPYAGAVMNAVLVPSVGGGYTLSGAPYSGRIGPVTLDSTGKFTVNFGDVTLISPGSPQWQITIDSAAASIQLPLGTGPQSFSFTSSGTTISGSSPVSLTISLNALAPKLTNFVASGTVTSVTGTSPIVSSGGAAPAISCPTCNAVAPNTAGIPANNGANNFYVANTTGVKHDAYSVFDAVCSNGSNIVTSASAHFLSAPISVGQTIWAVPGAGQGNSVPSIPMTTVLSVDSDTQIHTTANGNGGCGSAQFLVWGDDDFPAIHGTFEPAFYATAQINCGIAHLPGGGIMLSGGIINKPAPASCNPPQTYNSYGMVGEGITDTVIYPTPNFDPTTCTGSGKLNCFGPSNGVRHDFGIQGGGLIQTASASTTFTAIEADSPQSIHDVSCLYWAAGDANMTGLLTTFSQLFEGPNLEFANCGALGPAWSAGANTGIVYGNYFVPTTQITIASGTPGMDFISNWMGISGVSECATNITGFAHIFGLFMAPGAEGCITGGTVSISGSKTTHSQNIAGRAAWKLLSSANLNATGSIFSDAGTGEFPVSVDSTSSFTDGCGNSYTGPVNVASGGKFTPCYGQVYPASSVLQLAGITGTGACAAPSTILGNVFKGSAVCPGSTGASTFIVTPGTTAVSGWNCQGTYDKTTYALPTALTYNGTSCTATFASVTANDVIAFSAAPF